MYLTDNNMSVIFGAGLLDDFSGHSLFVVAKKVVYTSPADQYNGVGPNNVYYTQVSECVEIQQGGTGVSIEGSTYPLDYASYGDELIFVIITNDDTIIMIDVIPYLTYVPNGFAFIDEQDAVSFTIEGANVVHGCMDNNYLEFNPFANIDNGSCQEIRVDGCTDILSCVYNEDANFDNGSCIYETEQSLFNTCCLDNLVTSICPSVENCATTDIDCVNLGCMSSWADNFDVFVNEDDGSCYKMGCTEDWADNYDNVSTENDGSCYKMGCTEDWADNYDNVSTENDGSCYKYGCTADWADNFDNVSTENDGSCYKMGCTEDWADNYDNISTENDGSCSLESCTSPWADNYDSNATIDDGSCIYSQDYVHGLWNEVDDGAIIFNEAVESLSSLQQALNTWNTTIDLSAGWNMFGYGCPTSIDLVQGLSSHTELIAMVKDNNGSAYIPEFDFNGIGDLTPGFGYQIKVTEAIEGFSLCDWYVNDIPEDNIVSLQEEVASLQAEFDSIYGCLDENACNYDALAALDDGSCYDNDLGCGCDTPGPIEGFNCDGIEVIGQIGDTLFGGIVFYVDETGQHGLVASLESLGPYFWSCHQGSVNGANEEIIGTGYQNTLDIINDGCVNHEELEVLSGAHAAFHFDAQGYNDWFLPSKYELIEMFNTISGVWEINNGFFEYPYWSSTQKWGGNAWIVSFSDGQVLYMGKFNNYYVRPIRSF
jgi:hypothetical protein